MYTDVEKMQAKQQAPFGRWKAMKLPWELSPTIKVFAVSFYSSNYSHRHWWIMINSFLNKNICGTYIYQYKYIDDILIL